MRGSAVGSGAQRRRDHLEHAVDIPEHVIVPETEDGEAARFDRGGAIGVGFGRMLAAVQLDDQLRRNAGEVRDMAADGILTAEFMTIELARAEA